MFKRIILDENRDVEHEIVNELAHLLTAYGIGPWLSYTRTMIVLARPDGTLLERNPAFEVFEKSAGAAHGLRELLSAASLPHFEHALQAAFSDNQPRREMLELQAGSEHRPCDCLVVPLPDGNFIFLAETPERLDNKPRSEQIARLMRDLKETRRALRVKQTGLEAVLAQVDEIAHTDQLTFLSNQRKIAGDLQRMVTHAHQSRWPLTIFMIDIDRFKLINDTYGHISGDQVLRKLSAELRSGIRHSDRIGRYGGEEFLILLPSTPVEAAIPMAERLLALARDVVVLAGTRPVQVTVSIGIAQYHRGETWKDLLDRADKALYQSKNAGRDRWTFAKFEDEQPGV